MTAVVALENKALKRALVINSRIHNPFMTGVITERVSELKRRMQREVVEIEFLKKDGTITRRFATTMGRWQENISTAEGHRVMIGMLLLFGIAKNRLGDAAKFNRLSRFIRVMAECIMAILRSQLMVVFSWGFRRPTALPDDRGLTFEVDGFLYKGRVEVIYNDALDLFEVRLADGRVEEMVYCDNLVAVIDGMVERCNNYIERVQAEYSNPA